MGTDDVAARGCPEWRYDIAAYVLGSISPAERTALEEHLRDCPSCQDQLTQFAGLPGLLARARRATDD
jgi:anti-sigma factor RsiW